MMTVLATLGNPPHFEVSRIDIDREGVSYTIDTLHILREQYGPGCELFSLRGPMPFSRLLIGKILINF